MHFNDQGLGPEKKGGWETELKGLKSSFLLTSSASVAPGTPTKGSPAGLLEVGQEGGSPRHQQIRASGLLG